MGGSNTPKWMVYYDDRPPIMSGAVSPEDIPSDGIQWILYQHPEYGPQLLWGAEYYLWIEDRWHGLYLNDLERHLRKLVPALKYGRTTGDAAQAEAYMLGISEQQSWQ